MKFVSAPSNLCFWAVIDVFELRANVLERACVCGIISEHFRSIVHGLEVILRFDKGVKWCPCLGSHRLVGEHMREQASSQLTGATTLCDKE